MIDLTKARAALAADVAQTSTRPQMRAALDSALARVDELEAEVAGLTHERTAIAANADRIFCAACDRLDAHEAPGVTLTERIDGLARERDKLRALLAATRAGGGA